MKVILTYVFILISFFQVNAQQFELENVEWVDSLRSYLAIDSVYCLDSLISFKSHNNTFNIYISKKRPNLEKALLLVDSIYWQLDNDTTYARLKTILYEFDVKYQSEFVYTIDYFQSAYHKERKNEQSKILNEYKLIGEIEGALQAKKLLRDSSISIIELLGYKDIKYWIEIHDPVSSTWEKFGSIDLSFLKRVYNNNYEVFEKDLKHFLTKEISINEYYKICYVFNLFNRTDPLKIDCERIRFLIDKQTSQNFISALKNLNNKFHNSSCLNEILKKY